MKRIMLAILSMAVLTALAATSTPEGWTDDLDAALKQAKTEKKLVLVDFSGSDWCGWCKRLDREVFGTEEFRTGAKDKYVLVMIDSPRDKSLLSAKAKDKNPKLTKKYGIRGFPTVLILDGNGKTLFQTGYKSGGPEKYLEMLDREVKDAPDVEKFIKPIEKPLSDIQDEIEKSYRQIARGMALKLNKPKSGATKEEREAFWKNARELIDQQFQETTVPKFLPRLEKALAKAKSASVPENLEERKSDLIGHYQSIFDKLNAGSKKAGEK